MASSSLRLSVLAAGAAAAAAQWNQFTRCQITGTCVTFTLSLSNVQPSAFWSLGTTIPFSEEVADALNLPANGVNTGDIGSIILGSQTNQVGLNYVLIQRSDTGDLIFRGGDPGVAGSIVDTKVGYFNGGGPQYVSAQALLATTNVHYQYSGATTVEEANKIGSRIVTNKAMRFTAPLVDGLGLSARAAVVIAGDSTPHAKPHPAPLLEAARRIGVAAAACVYIGDDHRDIVAGQAAGMGTLAAAWGYLGQGEPVHAWGADGVLSSPAELLQWLELA